MATGQQIGLGMPAPPALTPCIDLPFPEEISLEDLILLAPFGQGAAQ